MQYHRSVSCVVAALLGVAAHADAGAGQVALPRVTLELTQGRDVERTWTSSTWTQDNAVYDWRVGLGLAWPLQASARGSSGGGGSPALLPSPEEKHPQHAAPPAATAQEILGRFLAEPSLQEVQGWVQKTFHSSPESIQKWLRQARRFGWLPDVTVQLDLAIQEDQGFDFLDLDGGAPLPGSEVAAVNDDVDLGYDRDVTLQLSWDLDKLVMSHERIRATSEAHKWLETRDRVLRDAAALYVERRRVQVSGVLAPPNEGVNVKIERHLRLVELTAGLDALTSGAFSRALPVR